MASTHSPKAKKIAALSIAGTIITQLVPTTALGNEATPITNPSELRCLTQTPTQPENAPTQAEIDAKEAAQTQIQAQLDATRTALNEAQDAETNVQTQVTATKNTLPTTSTQTQNLLDELAQLLEAEKTKEAQAVATAEANLNTAQTEANKAQNAVKEAQTAAQAADATYQTARENAQTTADNYTNALQPQDQKPDGSHPTASDLQTRIDALNAENQRIAPLKEQQTTEVANLNQALQNAQTSATALETALNEIQTQLTQLQADLATKNQQLAAAQATQEQAQTALNQAQAEAGPQSATYQAKQQELETATQNRAAAAAAVADLENQIAQLEAEKTTNQEAKTAAETELAQKTQELAEAQTQLDALTQQQRDIETQIAQQNALITQLENRLAEVERELADAQNGTNQPGTSSGSTTPDDPAVPTDPADPAEQPGVYNSFAALIKALNEGVTDARLGKDLNASEIPETPGTAYVNTPFAGTLDGAGYTIHGLTKPLFDSLAAGSSVTNLTLNNVAIDSNTTYTGALANQTNNAQISAVHATGQVTGTNNVGGLVGQATGNTLINDVTYAGTVISQGRSGKDRVGGVVAHMQGGTISQSGFQGDIYANHNGSSHNRAGGVVGHLEERGTATSIYAGGTLHSINPGAQAGGLVGSLWADSGNHGRIRNGVTAMNVINGMQVLGDSNHTTAAIAGVSAWEGEAQGGAENPRKVTVLGGQDVQDHYDSLGLSKDLRGTTTTTTPDTVAADRKLAYENYRKLLPYADEETLVNAVNALPANDPLLSKELIAALPTVNGVVTLDSIRDKATINGLLLHFADNTVDRRVLAYDNRATTNVGQYYMEGQLPYTPAQLTAVDTATVNRVVETLKNRNWEDINTPENAAAFNEFKTAETMRAALYLRETINTQKETLAAQINDLFARENALTGGKSTAGALEKKILAHQDQILLGLAYLNKWYNIDFNGNKLSNLLLANFHGGTSTTDLLIKLGSDYQLLDPRRNPQTYRELFYLLTKQANIYDLLDLTRQQFTAHQNFNDWFKATSKAYIVEAPSVERPDVSVKITDKLKADTGYHNMFLPLLTTSEGSVWVTVHMSSIAFGAFEKYYNVRTVTTPEARAQKVAEIKQMVDNAAEKYREYFDMWYRVGNETMRNNLVRAVPVWDGFSYDNGWTEKYGPGNFTSVEEFYGPVGRWYPANGLAGYSNRNGTWMVASGMLHPGYNLSIYTHEMTHNLSYRVMLGGYGEREGSHAELYPTSFLQNPYSRQHDVLGFNQADHYAGQNGAYMHNEHPDRFANTADLEQYFKGYFDALYLLDNLEADAILSQDDETKARLVLRLANLADGTRGHLNNYQALTAEEIANMGLTSIRDLIANELMIHRGYGAGAVIRNGSYVSIAALNPLYGTAESDLGITGEAAFKRNAYELLAAKGFENGWVAYTSNKYLAEARAAGKPSLPDTFIMPKIFAEEGYTSLKEYRQHAYEANRARAQQMLKPITVSFLGVTETFTSYEQIAQRFQTYMAADLAVGFERNTNRSRVYLFKRALFSALMAQTEEFRSSIFTDGDSTVPPRVAVKTAEIIRSTTQQPTGTPVKEITQPAYATATLPAIPAGPGIVGGSDANVGSASDTGSGSGSASGSDSGSGSASGGVDTSALEAERARLQAEIAATNSELGRLSNALGNNETAQQTTANQIANTTAQTQNLRARRDQLTADLTAVENRLQQLQEAKTTENQRQLSAQQAAEAARKALEEMAQRVAAAQQLADNAATKLADAQQTQATAQANVNAMQTQQTQVADQLAGKQAEISRLNQQLEATTQILAATDEEITRRNTEIARLQALLQLSQQATTAATQADAARAQLEQKTAAAQTAAAGAQTAAQRVNEAAQALQEAQQNQRELRDETPQTLLADPTKVQNHPNVAALLARIGELSAADQAALQAYQAAVTAAQEKLDAAVTYRKRVEAGVKLLETQLRTANEELAALRLARKTAVAEQTETSCVRANPPYVVLPSIDIYQLIEAEDGQPEIKASESESGGSGPEAGAAAVEQGAAVTAAPVKKLQLANTGAETGGLMFIAFGSGVAGMYLMRRAQKRQ